MGLEPGAQRSEAGLDLAGGGGEQLKIATDAAARRGAGMGGGAQVEQAVGGASERDGERGEQGIEREGGGRGHDAVQSSRSGRRKAYPSLRKVYPSLRGREGKGRRPGAGTPMGGRGRGGVYGTHALVKSPHQSEGLMRGKRDSNFTPSSTWKATVCGAWRRHSPRVAETGL